MKSEKPFRAVVIGTSAGGTEALQFLLPQIPADTPAAFLVVQHISPYSDSSFLSFLNQLCQIRVREACTTDEILPGTIYFAPPDYHLLVETNLTLTLSADEKVNYSRPSIDVLFETAADAFKDRLTGILLTGANSDGSSGLMHIKELGGETIVQEPDEALYPEMPLSALKLFAPGHILGLPKIADYLRDLGLRPFS